MKNFLLSKLGFTIIPTRTLAVLSLIAVSAGYTILSMNSRLLDQGLGNSTQVYVRILAGFLLSLILFRKHLRIEKIRSVPSHDWVWITLMGVVGYAGTVLFITLAALNAKLVNVAVITATGPFVVFLYSGLLLKEKTPKSILISLFIALYGISVVSSKSLLPSLQSFGRGEFFAFLSVVCGGWWSVSRKMVSDHLNTKEISMLTMLIAGLASLCVALIFAEPLSLSAFTMMPVLIGIAIGAGLNLLLTFLEIFAFKHLNVVFANQLLLTSTIFSLVGGILFYQEYVTGAELVGGLIILASVWQANKLVTE